VYLKSRRRRREHIESITFLQSHDLQESGLYNLVRGECTTFLQSHDLQEFGLCNPVRDECTTFLQSHNLQEFGHCNLVRGECTTALYNRLAREKVAKAKREGGEGEEGGAG